MKTINRIFHNPIALWLMGGIMLMALSGCNKFLEEYSQDERVPKDVREFSEILFGEAYIKDNPIPFGYLDLMTDDVQVAFVGYNERADDTRPEAYGYYTWQPIPEIKPNGAMGYDRTWEEMYKQILTSNIILKAMDEMTGADSDKEFLKGECYAVRAFAYFMLANIYAPSYDPQTAKTTRAVPINEKSYAEDAKFPKAMLSEVYAQIVSDIEKGIEAFDKSNKPNTIFRWNKAALATLGSRVHLYMHDYDKSIKYATLALSLSPSLYDLNKKKVTDPENSTAFLNKDNNEVLFTYGFWTMPYYSSANKTYFPPSEDLLSIYTEGDLRYFDGMGAFALKKKIGGWFTPVYAFSQNKSGMVQDTKIFGQSIRIAEALMNRAEAYAEKGELNKSIADLKTISIARYEIGKAPVYTASSKDEVIKQVRLEKRKEFALEGLRWFDLRRWGQPEIKHEYITNLDTGETESFTLKAKDPRYTLPVPEAVRISDPALSE